MRQLSNPPPLTGEAVLGNQDTEVSVISTGY